MGFIVITLNLVTILVVFTIYVLKLRPKKSDINCTNNNKILDTNKITASSLFSRNKNPIELKSNEAPVDVSKKETQISPVLSNIEVDVWDKNTYLKKIII